MTPAQRAMMKKTKERKALQAMDDAFGGNQARLKALYGSGISEDTQEDRSQSHQRVATEHRDRRPDDAFAKATDNFLAILGVPKGYRGKSET